MKNISILQVSVMLSTLSIIGCASGRHLDQARSKNISRNIATSSNTTTNKIKRINDFEAASKNSKWDGPQMFCGSSFGEYFYRFDLDTNRQVQKVLYSVLIKIDERDKPMMWLGSGVPTWAENTSSRVKVKTNNNFDPKYDKDGRVFEIFDTVKLHCRDHKSHYGQVCYDPVGDSSTGGDLVCDDNWESVKNDVIKHPYSQVD